MKEQLSAGETVERITERLKREGVPWQASVLDGFKAGNPETPVHGIAVTFKATFDVMRSAVAHGLNFIISHESFYWDGIDSPHVMRQEATHQAKEQFARDHGLVIWRLHDHMHRMHPDPIFQGLLSRLGWTPSQGHALNGVSIPETSLVSLAAAVSDRLDTTNVSVVGDSDLIVRRVGFGIHILSTVLPALREADVAIVGETAEYDTFEYVRDAGALGMPKAVIRISHERLEEWGMPEFVDWLYRLELEVPIEWLSSGDPFVSLAGGARSGNRDSAGSA
jgi:putative NIF3 family GTP cyclohydrolase 1 type 2